MELIVLVVALVAALAGVTNAVLNLWSRIEREVLKAKRTRVK